MLLIPGYFRPIKSPVTPNNVTGVSKM